MTASSEAARLDATPRRNPKLQALLDLPRSEIRRAIKSLPPRQRLRLLYDWEFWGRPEQIWRPGPEIHTGYLSGRGFGKTRIGAEALRWIARHPEHAGGRARRGPRDRNYGVGAMTGIAGRTANDVNETMLYGPSGVMTVTPEDERPRHHASRKILIWPSGMVTRLMSGDAPDSFRGPNLGWVWTDELAHWSKLKRALAALLLTLRHGRFPRALHTTTPLAVTPLLELLLAMEDGAPRPAAEGEASLQGFALRPGVRVVTGSTYDNADNLARNYLTDTVGRFEGTEVGDQELRGAILFESKGAPWRRDWIQRCEPEDVPELVAIGVGVDPTVSEGEVVKITGEPCECGIVTVGLGRDGLLYVLGDASGVMSPGQWAAEVWRQVGIHDADCVFIEDNQGGLLVENTLAAVAPKGRVKIQRVRATRNKFERAGLVSHLWELGKVRHVGSPRKLVRVEHQMCHFDPARGNNQQSDRMDALVWATLGTLGDGTDRKRLRGLSNAEAWHRIVAELQARSRR